MEQKYSINIQPGDLIVVPYNNHLYHGVFKRWGSSGNPQYYNTGDADYVEGLRARIAQGQRIWGQHLSRRGGRCVVKLDVGNVSADVRAEYFSTLSVLREANLV